MWREFRAFLTKSNALALAVGVIIGAAVGSVVTALTQDILMPIISLVLPSGDWRQSRWVLGRGVDAAGKVTVNAVLYGHFAGALVDFVIIAFVIFLVTRALLRPAPSAPTKTCPLCLEVIPAAATRCRACTAAV
jgi:large conductance mechanosensitive channel